MSYYSNTSNIGCGLLLVLFAIAICIDALVAWGCQALWNWLAPLFWAEAPILTYWQAFGAFILLSIIGSLFKSTTYKS